MWSRDSKQKIFGGISSWGPPLGPLLVVVAAPWPFGSVTPQPASILVACLVMLFALVFASDAFRGVVYAPPGLRWIGLGLFLVVLQLLPLPPGWVASVAPAVGSVFEPLASELQMEGWHPVSIEPFESRWMAVQLLGLICAFYLASRLFRRGSERRLLAYAVTVVGVALSLFAVYQKARFGTVLYGKFPVPSATPFGPFVNHNHFAGYVEACALVALGTALGTARRNGSLALLLGGAAAIMGIAHVLSHSRGGLLAASAGLAALAWLSQFRQSRSRRSWMLIGGLAVASFLLIFAPASLFDRLSTLKNPGRDDAVQFRLGLWSDSLVLAGRSPLLGTGLGTYASIIPAYRSGFDEVRAEYAESDWLQLLCEAGIIGLILTGGFFFTIFRRARENIEREPSERCRGVLHGVLAAVVALIVHGLYDFNLHIPSNALLFVVLLGVLAPAKRQAQLPGKAFIRYAAVCVTAALSLALVGESLQLGSARELTRRIDPVLAEAVELPELIQTLSRSLELVPGNPRAAYLLGRLYNEEAYRSRDAARYRGLRFHQAAEAFRRAVSLAPAQGRYWFELAWTEGNRRNDELADRLFAYALTLEPHLSNLRANYALYLASRGRIDQALDQLEAGRKLRPGLSAMEALNVIGPYIGDNAMMLRRAAGEGTEAKEALARYRASQTEPKGQ